MAKLLLTRTNLLPFSRLGLNGPLICYEGRIALQAAAETDDAEIIHLLLEYGADVKSATSRHTRGYLLFKSLPFRVIELL
jgi:ankyrin repeat protein